MAESLKQYRDRCGADRSYFLANEFRVQGAVEAGCNGTDLVKFRENAPQRRLRETVEAMLRHGGRAWIQLLKARQFGGSTLFQGLCAHAMIFKPRTQALLVSYSDDSVEHILGLARLGLEELDLLGRDKEYFPRRKGTTFRLKNGSKFDGETAGAGLGTHSFTYQVAHLSERSRWSHEQSVMTGVGPATKNAWLLLDEATAAGRRGGFWTDWKRGMTLAEWLAAPSSRRTHVNVFVPFYECEWYRAEVEAELEKIWRKEPEELVRRGIIDAESVEVGRKFKLDLGQVVWRLQTIHSKACQGDPNRFLEQYPTDPETCWLAGGRKVFNVSVIKGRLDGIKEPMARYEVTTEFQSRAGGPLWVWEEAIPDHEYVIGVDPSVSEEGTAYGGIEVLDASAELRQVAEYNAPRTPRDLARISAIVGIRYNTAMIAPERRNHGAAFVDSLINEYQYGHVYQFAGDNLSIRSADENLVGYDTTSKVRQLLFQEGRDTFPLLRHKIFSERLVDEAAELQLDDDSLKRTPQGEFKHGHKLATTRSDLWWAWCFAVYAAKRMGMVKALTSEKPAEEIRPVVSEMEGAFYDSAVGGYW